jgi:hypothetical protein
MHRTPRTPGLPFAAAGALLTSVLVAHAQVPADKAVALPPEAVAGCERAARQSLAEQAAPPSEVAFNAAPLLDKSLSNESQLVLRGTGRSRGANGAARTFSYSCNVEAKSGETVGLVLRDVIAVAARPEPAKPPAEPDLSHLSPGACESSAAQVLKQRWPRVSQISFDPETRRFQQDSAEKASLHGRGRALPAPDVQPALFGFDCEIDPRDGRVLATRVSG